MKLQGGLLDFVTREIQVECLPADIPEHIDVDVTELELHESIRLRDVAADAKWKPVTDGDTMLVHVVMPKAEESAAAADGGGAGGGGGGRARGHQEGQDRQGKTRRTKGQEGQEVGSDLLKRAAAVRLIVGLGNPGKEYRETRHNVGFMVVDEIARRHGLTWAMAPGAGAGDVRGQAVRRRAACCWPSR